MIPTPDPIPERSSPTRSLSPREGSVDGWGKYGLRSSLLAFKTKWRKKGQKQVSPRQRLGDKFAINIRPEWAKELLFHPPLCHSVVVGCHSFAPFGGVSLRHPLPPRALPGADISMPHSGRKPSPNIYLTPTPLFMTEGQKDMIPPPFGRAGWASPSSSREGRDGFL